MKLSETMETLSKTIEEDWMGMSGMRVIPENRIDESALKQVWEKQALEMWSLEGRDTPFDKAGFSESLSFSENGFATGTVILNKDGFNPMAVLSNTAAIPITIFWLWEAEKIQAYWSVSNADTDYVLNSQSNYASYPVVFA